jgi:hypothetical protein
MIVGACDQVKGELTPRRYRRSPNLDKARFFLAHIPGLFLNRFKAIGRAKS